MNETTLSAIDQINAVLSALVDPQIRKISSLDAILEEDEMVLVVNTMTGTMELYDLCAGPLDELEPIATARISIPE